MSATSIIYYAPLWIRQPHSFSGQSLRELIDHLFVQYAVPAVLYQAWLGAAPHHHQQAKWRQWSLCFGQGGSLYKLGQLAQGWSVSKQLAHQFAHTPAAESIQQTTTRAELAILGVSSRAAEWLLSSQHYVLDVTAHWNDYDWTFLHHWRDTARWIQRNIDQLDQATTHYLLNWSYEQVRVYNHAFRWTGRTVAASVQHADALAESRGLGHLRWHSQGMNWQGPDGWKIVELTSTKALSDEGGALSHCVGGYSLHCKSGGSAIFSLRRNGESRITIQLEVTSRTVVQALGYQNRPCSVEEMAVIQQWLTDLDGGQS